MTEQTRLERWDQRTDWPLAGVALAFLALYSVKVLVRPEGGADKAVDVALLGVYCIFVADYAARLSISRILAAGGSSDISGRCRSSCCHSFVRCGC